MQTVVVVEDEPAVAGVIRSALEDEGYQVLVAYDGRAGLQLVQKAHPDLVLTDIMVPYLDGIALARRVRADPGLADLPVVLMSAARRYDPEIREVCRAFISKPFDLDTLLAVVERQLA